MSKIKSLTAKKIIKVIKWKNYYNIPSVVKISTSHNDKDPSTPTNCRNTCWPISVLAQVNVFVTPSSEIYSNSKYH